MYPLCLQQKKQRFAARLARLMGAPQRDIQPSSDPWVHDVHDTDASEDSVILC